MMMRFTVSQPKYHPSPPPPPPQPQQPRNSNLMVNSWKRVPCMQFNQPSAKKGCGCGGG